MAANAPVCSGARLSDVFKVIEDSLIKGRKYSEEGNFGRSFAHYLVVLHLIPPYLRQEFEEEFTHVLNHWGNELHRRSEYEDVFRCYHIAVKYFPTNVDILNHLGAHALKLQCYATAKQYFENALRFDPHYLPAEQNLQTLRYTMVDRWHFPMLNDVVRNKAYAQAIFAEISRGFTNILDVGTGTGLLSMYASKCCQVQSVTACDYSEAMFEIANKVLQTNDAGNVKLLNKNSTNLTIPDDLNEKVTLLVTEILDCGIFGENIINTLIHAWEHLMVPYPMGKIIPAGVVIYVVGIRSPELSRKVRVHPRRNNILKINDMCLSHSALPYDSENLRTAAVDYVTEPQKALSVDFNSVEQLKQLADPTFENPTVKLKCVKNSTVDAFAIWFTLHLNGSVSLTNNPNHSAQQTSWEQAVAYLKHPLIVQENEEVEIRLDCSKGYVEIKCPKEDENNAKMSRANCFEIPRNAVLYLNDTQLLDAIETVASKLWAMPAGEVIHVLDVSPFPILGLLLAKLDARLTVRTKDTNMENAIRHMCELNDIAQENVTFVDAKSFRDYITHGLKFDIVFQNVISMHGLLNEAELYQAQILSMCMNENGIIMPKNVHVWAQIVDCKWLDSATRVDDDNVVGFKIADHINVFKSVDHLDMNFDKIDHTPLSNPVNLGSITEDTMQCHTSSTSVRISADGTANAVFYWYEVEIFPGISVSTRRPDAFATNAAFMLSQAVPVTKKHILSLQMKQHEGILKISVDKIHRFGKVSN
ncbi:Arginine methyltransferase 2 [Carabus blaptoides fortunei]